MGGVTCKVAVACLTFGSFTSFASAGPFRPSSGDNREGGLYTDPLTVLNGKPPGTAPAVSPISACSCDYTKTPEKCVTRTQICSICVQAVHLMHAGGYDNPIASCASQQDGGARVFCETLAEQLKSAAEHIEKRMNTLQYAWGGGFAASQTVCCESKCCCWPSAP